MQTMNIHDVKSVQVSEKRTIDTKCSVTGDEFSYTKSEIEIIDANGAKFTITLFWGKEDEAKV